MENNDLILLSAPVFYGNEAEYLRECIDSGWVSSGGRFVSDFEHKTAEYVEAKNAVACVNGTAALHLALVITGVGPGDEVIVPTLTFIAPINTVKYVNAEPVFMDCDDYLNLDVDKLESFIASECNFRDGKLTNRSTGRHIKAIIPVHIFGAVCNMSRILDLAQKYNLTVIEDATEALGSKITAGSLAGKYAGTLARIGCYSFNGNKIITCGGGGMMVTDDESIADKARYLSTQANNDSLHYRHDEIGYNYRLTALQAAVGLAQLEQLDSYLEIKRRNFKLYQESIQHIPGLTLLQPPPYCQSNLWFYSLLIDEKAYGMDRDTLLKRFLEHNIQVRPVWKLNHRQKPYLNAQHYSIEKALVYEQNILNIPCSVDLDEAQVKRVVSVLA